MKQIWTDGSFGAGQCGGWAFIIVEENDVLTVCGGEVGTTSQRMELTALLQAFKKIEESGIEGPFSIHTDSSYLKNCFTRRWFAKWIMVGWINSEGKPVANRDLWEQLIPHVERHNPKWVKVKGHTGVYLNEWCDKLAKHGRKMVYTAMMEEGTS